jgi:bifunctional DNA-binding transcriptional regulator/antitoxin component of YhaV-PrlF toxin-antitoxin module
LVKLKVKAIKVGNSIRVAIPSDVLRESSIAAGDTLLVDYDTKAKRITLEKESA